MHTASAAAQYLAVNILALRKKSGRSQNQLSKLADIPRSTITNMESGGGNPSLANLCKIAAALGVSIEELLTRPRSDCTLVKAPDVPVINRSTGKVQVFKLMPDKVRGIEIDKIVFQGNASMGGRPHVPGSKEYMMTIDGEVLVSVAGESYAVAEGDVLAFPGDQRHAYRNNKSQPATVLSVVLPVIPT